MKIGIIGAGAIGMAFARQASRAGYELVLSNSRGPSSLIQVVKEFGTGVIAGTVRQAAEAELVFVALQWQHMADVLKSITWNGQVLIDPANPILPGFKLAELYGLASSEQVAQWAPGTSVVKAFNTLPPPLLAADPKQQGGNRVIFYSGDDIIAKQKVAAVINTLGFAGIDLGRLAEGGKLSQFPGGPLPSLNLLKLP